MPDSPARPGPPVPPSLAATPAETAGRSPARGPYGLPFPRARVTPAPPPERMVTFQARPRRKVAHPQQPGPAPGTTRAPGFLVIILVIVLVAGALWADRNRHDPVAGYGPIPQPGMSSVSGPGPGLQVGDLAPNFRLLGTDGDIVELASLRGQPVLIHFWTTWCLDCAADLPLMQDLSARYGEAVQVIGIDAGEPAARVDESAERHGVTYQVLLDRDEAVAAAYGVSIYPTTILIDADGVLHSIQAGPVAIDEVETGIDAMAAE